MNLKSLLGLVSLFSSSSQGTTSFARQPTPASVILITRNDEMALALMMARMVMALRKIALMVNFFGHGLDNGLGFLMAFMMMKYLGPDEGLDDDLDDDYTLALPE